MTADLVARARVLNKHAVAKLVGLFEDSRPEAAVRRAETLEELGDRRGAVIGLTGTPGAGKSSLVARLVPTMLARDPDLTVAVLAIDPASHTSGGALLGDRTRTRFGADERAFFRDPFNADHLDPCSLGGEDPISRRHVAGRAGAGLADHGGRA